MYAPVLGLGMTGLHGSSRTNGAGSDGACSKRPVLLPSASLGEFDVTKEVPSCTTELATALAPGCIAALMATLMSAAELPLSPITEANCTTNSAPTILPGSPMTSGCARIPPGICAIIAASDAKPVCALKLVSVPVPRHGNSRCSPCRRSCGRAWSDAVFGITVPDAGLKDAGVGIDRPVFAVRVIASQSS